MGKKFLDYEGLKTYHKNVKAQLDKKANKEDLNNKVNKDDIVALTEEEIIEILSK